MDAIAKVERRCGMILTYIMFFLLEMVAQVLLDKLRERLKKELGEGDAE